MKTILFAIVAAASLVLPAHADIAIWRVNMTIKAVGGGSTVSGEHTGFILMDMTSQAVQWIDVGVRGSGAFIVNNESLAYVVTAATGANTEATAIYLPFSGASHGGIFWTGADTLINLGSGTNYWTPKALSIQGRYATVNSDGVSSIVQYTGTATLDVKDTTATNSLQASLADEVNALVQRLTNEGLNQLPNASSN
jgi:hypothetical protein